MADSPQFNDSAFRNPGRNIKFSVSTAVSSMWDFLFNGRNKKPNIELPVQNVDLARFEGRSDDQLQATWLGHSSLMINIDGVRILADPVFEKSVSIFGPTRFNGDLPIDVERIAEIDLVVISHNHYDHLNEYSIRQIAPKTPLFIVPLGVAELLETWNVPANKIIELDWWEEYRVNETLTVVATPAQHFSGRGLTDRNKTLWVSYVIKSKNHNLFFGGDSGYFDGFKEIGAKHGPFDMTFLECGAYNKNWSEIHMFPEQTLQAHLDLKGDVLHPIHWGTYDLAIHAWFDPMQRLATAAQEADVTIATPIVGGTTSYSDDVSSERWWKPAMASDLNSKK